MMKLTNREPKTCAKTIFGALIFFYLLTPSVAQTVYVEQGKDWTDANRSAFYVQDQGSRIMPLAWMRALRQEDGDGFLSDSLNRFGYLPNPDNGEMDIPVGFTIAPDDVGKPSIGMTCSACHTREIDVNGTAYRIDGGPAVVDFQSFLRDLDTAVGAVLSTAQTFGGFASRVLGPGAPDTAIAALRLEVEQWYLRYHTLIERSLPTPAWGPSRLDAVSMIFNRLTGLDIGKGSLYLIPDNIYSADAPTRYPFLWNAARQDKTQWPGFAKNGNDILGLARNLGEVYGVFAEFHPVKQTGFLKLNRDYITNNSANFSGLKKLEDQIWKIGPPKWPWRLDQKLVSLGRQIYNRPTDQGGCTECHGIKTGEFRSPFHETWATPVLDVGTDSRECRILERTVKTGVMDGARIPLIGGTLGDTEPAFKVLSFSVIGGIIQNTVRSGIKDKLANLSVKDRLKRGLDFDLDRDLDKVLDRFPDLKHLKQAYRTPDQLKSEQPNMPKTFAAASGCAYESRVLQGIWAAAPYLHNGSVPSLEELLKPAKDRVSSFKIGPSYDIKAVGLAKEQTKFDYTLETTDCSDSSSGNSRCGHEYGTTHLSSSEKSALIEYLKSL